MIKILTLVSLDPDSSKSWLLILSIMAVENRLRFGSTLVQVNSG
jgi:hypothetical protein